MRHGTLLAAAQTLEPTSLNLSGFPVEYLFSGLDSFKIGVALFDRRLRFTAVSRVLAEFNNLPVEAHPGKSMHVVAPVSLIKKAEPSFEHVFSTGQPLPHVRRSARLLTRPGTLLHWLSYYFPLMDHRRRVVEVGVMVMELKSSTVAVGPVNAKPLQPHLILSSREQQVTSLLAEGKSNKEISSILAISVKTVETYRSRIMLKLRAPSLIYLVHYAIRHGLVDLQP